jgi:thioesterase domain-containing protein
MRRRLGRLAERVLRAAWREGPTRAARRSRVRQRRRMQPRYRRRTVAANHAVRTHQAGPYQGRVVLFRAHVRPLLFGFTRDLNWRASGAPHVEIVDLPGNHATLLRSPHAAIVARRLQAALDDPAPFGLPAAS